MKKLLFATLILMAALVTLASAAPIVFSFGTDAEVTSFISSASGTQTSCEDGFMKYVFNNTDPSYTHKFSTDSFNVDSYPYVKYRYKLDLGSDEALKRQGQIFFHTDSSPAMGSSGSGTYCYFEIVADGTWQTTVVNLSKIANSAWKGNIDTFRIDPIAVSDGNEYTGYADYIAFFETEEEANLFTTDAQKEYEKNHRPNSALLVTTVEKDGVKAIVNRDSDILSTTDESQYVMANTDTSAGDTVTVIKDDGTETLLPLSFNTGDKYVYIARGEGKYIPSSYSKSFVDTANHWADEYIAFTSARKLFGGTSETEFSPEDTMTRGMYITVLGRMHGVDTSKYVGKAYDDVNENKYYNPYILWAKNNNILDNKLTAFRPEEPITRLEMAVLTASYIKYCGYDLSGTGKMVEFADTADVDIHSIGAIYMMQRIGVINGRTATTFEPQGIMTRAEVATVVTRLVKAILDVNPIAETENTASFDGENIIYKFDTNNAVASWAYYNNSDKGEIAADPATGAPAVMTEDGKSFVRLQNVNYMTSATAPDFDTTKYNVMSFKYRMNMAPPEPQYSYVYTDYFRINQNGYEYQKASALIRLGKNLVGDNQWHIINIDLTSPETIEAATGNAASNGVQGILESLRMDWRTYDGAYIDLEYIAFFENMKDAEAFTGSDDASWSTAVDTADATITADGLESYYKYQDNKLLIGAYDVKISTEEDVKLLAEAGMNFAFTNYGNVGHRNNILKWCYQYNIDVIFFDRAFSAPYESKFKKAYDGAEAMPNYLGSSIADEPGATSFPRLKEITDAVKSYAPDKYAYINLFPNYATARQLEGYPSDISTADRKSAYDASNKATMTFREHLERFAAEVSQNDLLSADIYPFLWSGTTKNTRDGYVQGLADMGDVARENDMRMSVIAQGVNYASSIRQPSEDDARFQAYASMAFGTTMLSYYTYDTRSNELGTALLDSHGVPSKTFYNVQPVNFEIQRISDVFMQYKSLGAFTVNATASSHPYLYFTQQYSDAAVAPTLDTAEPVLVGCFAKKQGAGNAYIILNGTDIKADKAITASVKFPTSGTVTAYYYGTPTVLTPDADGRYTISLDCAQGVLVTVD